MAIDDESFSDNGSDDYSFGVEESTEHTSTQFSDKPAPKPVIGAAENRRVFYSRILVAVVLGACAALTAVLTNIVTNNEEENNFKRDFAGITSEIIEVSTTNERNLVNIMLDFSTMITTSAIATNQEWPYVRIPNFERRANRSMTVSGGVSMAFVVPVAPTVEARAEWNAFFSDNIGWVNESYSARNETPRMPYLPYLSEFNPAYNFSNPEQAPIAIPAYSNTTHYPFWQMSPPPVSSLLINGDQQHNWFTQRWEYMNATGQPARALTGKATDFWINEPMTEPVNLYYQPVWRDFEDKPDLVAFIYLAMRFSNHFKNLLHDDAVVTIVIESTCDEPPFTYQVEGKDVEYLGLGDLHDMTYHDLGVSAILTEDLNSNNDGTNTGVSCGHSLHIYPTATLRATYETAKPVAYTLVVLGIFLFTTLVFVLYDCLVQRRQETVMDSAVRTNAIVSSLFPEQFREQMLRSAEEAKLNKKDAFRSNKASLQTFMNGGPGLTEDSDIQLSKPVADLFPNATVLFADIVGFTAWSSIREPSQVFTLLESIYRSFDIIAKRRGIYKVETVGDSYVAVAGVPVAMTNHALVMARFARDCAMKLPEVVHRLERFLGPGTGDLSMRFGIHSGPVTAGVLRGEKARFQLFGDTVNTAARIESSGKGNRVHLSEATAALLIEAGKDTWVEARPDEVHLRGKGTMKTFWLAPLRAQSHQGSVYDKSEASGVENVWGKLGAENDDIHHDAQIQRLVAWNSESLLRLLQHIVAGRGSTSETKPQHVSKLLPNHAPLEEVAEIISLPGFDAKRAGKKKVDPETVDLGPEVMKQLHSYIAWVANSYKKNPFHNFEHASHVSMSVNKLLSRIVAPEINLSEDADENQRQAKMSADLHNHTFGITSDPMTQFACALAALIHDADHRGVPNGQLVKEDEHLGKLYDQSVAEQNSVDISWAKLMSDEFKDLRACIYTNKTELKRFRQVIVNTVLATDIFDKKLKTLRNARWDKAFEERPPGSVLSLEDVNRKATIVIEHIIQASDVSHTMQHWHVYIKWNEKLFMENYRAYIDGRAEKDPSTGWYGGELWFFDNYVIPLAKKLAECGVFGVSSDEYLNYAKENRKEWEQKGKGIVQEMIKKYGGTNHSPEEEQAQEETPKEVEVPLETPTDIWV